MTRCRPLLIGAAMLAAPSILVAMPLPTDPTATPPAKPLIEVRESGAYAPLPHPAIIQIYADGRIKTLKGERRTEDKAVSALMDQLEKLGAFRLDQKTLDKEFRDVGEVPAGKRGGSGFVTLLFVRDKKPTVQVSLNQPNQFADSKAASVKRFVKALQLIRDFADPPPRKTANQKESRGG